MSNPIFLRNLGHEQKESRKPNEESKITKKYRKVSIVKVVRA